MAKPTGGLLAFDARGSLGKTIVYSTWRGRNYVRRHVVPNNPRSTAQTETRNLFSTLSELWKRSPPQLTESWTLQAKGKPFTDRNSFMGTNIQFITGLGTDLSALIWSSGAGGGFSPLSATFTPGANQITVALTPVAVPTGWTIVEAIATCTPNINPQTTSPGAVTAGTDTTSPYSIVLSSLTTAQQYVVGGWFKYTKPDGTFCYGFAASSLATPT